MRPHGVRVFVDSRDYAMAFDVRFIQDTPTGSYLGVLVDGRIEYQPFDLTALDVPSTFTLHGSEAEELAKALAPWKSRDVSAEALDDARTVRDRLLTLVERKLA